MNGADVKLSSQQDPDPVIRDTTESYWGILGYWLPETISFGMLVALPMIIDPLIVANLKSTTTYAALAVTTWFIHLIIKLAEAIPVASIAIIGRHNAAHEFEDCGKRLGDTFWTTFTSFAAFFFFFAKNIYQFLGVSNELIAIGVPYLRLQAASIPMIFIFMTLIGFMKAVKNTKVPMYINVTGICVFFFFDYALILGKFGFPQMRLMGAGVATMIRYSLMLVLAFWYLLKIPRYRKYFRQVFFSYFKLSEVKRLLNLSWPIMLDKASIAITYIMLGKMIAPIGTIALASMDVLKNMERFMLIPTLAFAQIVTFLVSNSMGAHDYQGAKNNIKRVYILASFFFALILLVPWLKTAFVVGLFDKENTLRSFVAPLMGPISTLAFLDMSQIILAGGLRGAGDVHSVMKNRLVICFLILAPALFLFRYLDFKPDWVAFSLVYVSFYAATGIMALRFLSRIRGNRWHKAKI
jgi:multidrug resistance protein, MATE family